MLHRWLPPWLRGVLMVVFMFPNLLLWSGLMTPGIVLKFVPITRLQRLGARFCVWSARRWVGVNQHIYRLFHAAPDANAYGEVQWRGHPQPGSSYLLISNHQTWADILILFDVFHGKVPFLRFFLKRDLLWVPIIGLVCWAMDFPFMKRHSRQAIARNPGLADEDLQTTRRACAIYREDPVTVVNFLEGTRYSPAKAADKPSPYRHLLRPKSAGLSFTLAAMGEQFAGVLDTTLVYQPTGRNLLWSWLVGEQARVQVVVEVIPVPSSLLHGDYAGDAAFREQFQHWVNDLWAAKDDRIAATRRALAQARPVG